MTLGVAKFTRFNRGTKFVEAAAKSLGVAYDLCRILPAKFLHLAGGNNQRGQGVEVVVTGGAREDTAIGGRPVFFLSVCLHVAQNNAALRPWEGFMGAARHPRCPFMYRRLKLA